MCHTMPETGFPPTMGTVARRELAAHGYTRFDQLTSVTAQELLAIHGVGPKAIRILTEELAARSLAFRNDGPNGGAAAADPAPTWRVAALIGRVGSSEILVEAGFDGAARLPTVAEPVPIEPFDADAFGAVTETVGTTLMPLRLTWQPVADWSSGSIVVEGEPLEVAPAGFRWLDVDGWEDRLEPADARDVVRRRRERADGVTDPHEPPWAKPGWFTRTSAWMVERLEEAGLPVTGSPRLVYQGPLAAVLRARSDGEATYLKCAGPAFAHEAAITHALARRAGDRVPAVLASDGAENWLLMRDHGGRLLDTVPEESWLEAMPVIGELQRLWIGATDEIRRAGGQSRPLAHLAATVPAMLDRNDLGARMDPEMREAWITALPRLVDACLALDDLGLPETLVHGDLHPGNVVIGTHGHVVVDWSDAAAGHPFVDLPTFLLRTKDVTVRRRLRDAYLDGWDGVRPRPRLETAVEGAMAVGSLYQVATYQALLPAMDVPDRALFEGADISWAQRMLQSLESGLEATLP